MPKNKRGPGTIYSTIEDNQGNKFTLLPGKARDGLEGTFKGGGKFGRVKLALNKDEQTLAVKIVKLSDDIKKREEELKELQKEVELNNKLDRPTTIIVDGHKAYLFQPFLPGKSLSSAFSENLKKIQRGTKKDPPDKRHKQVLNNMDVLINHMKMSLSCLKAIEDLHKRKILHCDLHAENVLYDAHSNQSSIIDFGLSQVLQGDTDQIVLSGVHPSILAPHLAKESYHLEQDDRHIYSKSSDLYSFGFSSFMDTGIIDLVKKYPCLDSFEKICNEISSYIANHVANNVESNMVETTEQAQQVIKNRKPIADIISSFELWNKQLALIRAQYAVLTPKVTTDLFVDENLQPKPNKTLSFRSEPIRGERKVLTELRQSSDDTRRKDPGTYKPK